MKTYIRLYYSAPLAENQAILFDSKQTHYLRHVMRMKEGDTLLAFNPTDGEWLVRINYLTKKEAHAQPVTRTRTPYTTPDIWLCFAPVKNTPLNYLAQKATELGVSKLLPIITDHTVVHKINHSRLEANTIEAAEQSRRLCVPEITAIQPLTDLLNHWPQERRLILCDESGGGTPIIPALSQLEPGPLALLIGPEGGFSQSELAKLHQTAYVTAVGLGPRILRADTAAIAALSCLMSVAGDWDTQPSFNEHYDT